MLLDWCRRRDWAGWDPYDALNSRLLKALPFLDAMVATVTDVYVKAAPQRITRCRSSSDLRS